MSQRFRAGTDAYKTALIDVAAIASIQGHRIQHLVTQDGTERLLDTGGHLQPAAYQDRGAAFANPGADILRGIGHHMLHIAARRMLAAGGPKAA